jgi:hypothetical protein
VLGTILTIIARELTEPDGEGRLFYDFRIILDLDLPFF